MASIAIPVGGYVPHADGYFEQLEKSCKLLSHIILFCLLSLCLSQKVHQENCEVDYILDDSGRRVQADDGYYLVSDEGFSCEFSRKFNWLNAMWVGYLMQL